jgi:hypothetical protein
MWPVLLQARRALIHGTDHAENHKYESVGYSCEELRYYWGRASLHRGAGSIAAGCHIQ